MIRSLHSIFKINAYKTLCLHYGYRAITPLLDYVSYVPPGPCDNVLEHHILHGAGENT